MILFANQYDIFQSTLPRGERQATHSMLSGKVNFNPRSHEGSDNYVLDVVKHLNYFNPRSHEGSDNYVLDVVKHLNYFNPRSHEGSDFSQYKMFFMLLISIHAPTRGATGEQGTKEQTLDISIHAPTRGATSCIKTGTSILCEFQSTLPRGERPASRRERSLISSLFQSTLPRGERLAMVVANSFTFKFQSTLPRGERPEQDHR